MEKFEYNYEPGFGEKVVESAKAPLLRSAPPVRGLLKGNAASMAVPSASISKPHWRRARCVADGDGDDHASHGSVRGAASSTSSSMRRPT